MSMYTTIKENFKSSKTSLIFSLIFFYSANLLYGFEVSNFTMIEKDLVDDDKFLYSNVVIDSNDKIHITYYDASKKTLKYTNNINNFWQIDTIDEKGMFSSIAIDSLNHVHICYYDYVNNCLMYVNNKYNKWTFSNIDNDKYTGKYNSIAIDSNDIPHVCYHDALNNSLNYATIQNNAWQTEKVRGSGGQFCNLAIDSSNKIHIIYQQKLKKIDGDYDFFIQYVNNSSGDWGEDDTITLSQRILDTSIKIDSNDFVHLTFSILMKNTMFNSLDSGIFYATNSTGEMKFINVCLSASKSRLYLDKQNNVHICYSDCYRQLGGGDIAYCNKSIPKYATNKTGSWVHKDVVDSSIIQDDIAVKNLSIVVNKEDIPEIFFSQGKSFLQCGSSPFDGSWEGQTNQEHPISFTINGDCLHNVKLTVEYTQNSKTTIISCIPSFFYTTSGYSFYVSENKYTIVGSFIDQNTIKGSWSYYISAGNTLEGTWVAHNPNNDGDINNEETIDYTKRDLFGLSDLIRSISSFAKIDDIERSAIDSVNPQEILKYIDIDNDNILNLKEVIFIFNYIAGRYIENPLALSGKWKRSSKKYYTGTYSNYYYTFYYDFVPVELNHIAIFQLTEKTIVNVNTWSGTTTISKQCNNSKYVGSTFKSELNTYNFISNQDKSITFSFSEDSLEVGTNNNDILSYSKTASLPSSCSRDDIDIMPKSKYEIFGIWKKSYPNKSIYYEISPVYSSNGYGASISKLTYSFSSGYKSCISNNGAIIDIENKKVIYSENDSSYILSVPSLNRMSIIDEASDTEELYSKMKYSGSIFDIRKNHCGY